MYIIIFLQYIYILIKEISINQLRKVIINKIYLKSILCENET